jgi:hypothetical protein
MIKMIINGKIFKYKDYLKTHKYYIEFQIVQILYASEY